MLPEILVLLALPFLTVGYILAGLWKAGEWLVHLFREHRIARIRAVKRTTEIELDRKQEELHRTILRLAEGLDMEAHEARKALIRDSFIASGHLPNRPG